MARLKKYIVLLPIFIMFLLGLFLLLLSNTDLYTSASTVSVRYYTFSYDTSPCKTETYNRSSTFRFILPTSGGYNPCHTLTGWTYSSNGTSYSPGDYGPWVYLDAGEFDVSMKFVAEWFPYRYTIVFDANGGECDTAQKSVYYDSYLNFPTATKDGYTFEGWEYKGKVYSGSTYVWNLGSNGTKATFTAKWGAKKYNIKYYHDITDTLQGSATVSCGDSLTLPTPTKEGHVLVNWKYRNSGPTASFRGATYNGTITVPDWGSANSEVPLEAQWKKETYTINFDSAGGSSVNSITVSYGDTYTSTSTPAWPTTTKTGYIFDGWTYNDITYKTSYTVTDFGADEVSVSFVASWTPITYTIRLHANNGTNDYVDVAMTYDTTKNLPNNTFKKANYLFRGWATTTTGELSVYNKQSMLNALSTQGEVYHLYAVWEETWAEHYIVPQGKGTSIEPYKISSSENLAWMSWYTENIGSLSGHFMQTGNIDLTGYEWLQIGNSKNAFIGNYNGNGYTIKNITMTTVLNVDNNHVGIFGYVKGGTISNICLWGKIEGAVNTGGITGYAMNSTFTSCTVFSDIEGVKNVGGIVGYLYNGMIESCQYYGNVAGSYSYGGCTGGIVGYVYGQSSTISKCYAKSTIRGYELLGGIVGYGFVSSLTIDSCAYEGSILGPSGQGAIVGGASSSKITVRNCYAKATEVYLGENKGMGYGTITNCIYEINNAKRYTGSNFGEWVLTSDHRLLPSALSWLAIGGVKLTSFSQITALGYVKA